MRGNSSWLKNLGEQILALTSIDKQRLCESMVDGKIPVSLEREANGVEHWDADPAINFNINIL